MDGGALKESAKAAGGIVEALKTQPSTMAMIVIAFGLLGFLFYQGRATNEQRVQMIELFQQDQVEMRTLLAKCVLPSK